MNITDALLGARRLADLGYSDDEVRHVLSSRRFSSEQEIIDALNEHRNSSSPSDPAPRARDALEGRVEVLEEALREISKGEGAFSRDQLKHAVNCIESMKAIARAAIAAPAAEGAGE